MKPKSRDIFLQSVVAAFIGAVIVLYFQHQENEKRRRHMEDQLRELSNHPPQLPPNLAPPGPPSLFKQTSPPASPVTASPAPATPPQ